MDEAKGHTFSKGCGIVRILAWPAYRNRVDNPYNWLLYTNLTSNSVVDECNAPILLRKPCDILHLHWPEAILNGKPFYKALAHAVAFIALIDLAKIRGARIVWTVHNLQSHEKVHPRVERIFRRALIRRLSGWISLSHSAKDLILAKFPEIARVPWAVIPHGHYRDVYPNQISKSQARIELGLPDTAKVYCFFGQIRAYKNVPELIDAFRELGDDSVLLVAGKPNPSSLESLVRHAADGDARVRLYLKFIPQDKIQVFLNAADLVVLPYTEILNSGSALLALSFNRPVLVPDKGSMAELKGQTGDAWVKTYPGTLTPSDLKEAMCVKTRLDSLGNSGNGIPKLPEWSDIAASTYTFYETALDRRSIVR